MDYIDFQKIVTGKIKSVCLKNAIKMQKTVFQPIELLKIIYEFVEKYDDKLLLLKEFMSVTDDEKILSYINFIISELKENLENLQSNNSNCIFELHIKDTPESYDERYICNSFNSAVALIDGFYKEYSCTPDEKARYEIVKRKIYDSSRDSFDEDFIMSCTLDCNKNICNICSDNNGNFYNCDGICYECDLLCMSNINIKFPAFVGYKDLVQFQDSDGSTSYGISWDEPEMQSEECYIIPLDCFALRYRNFDKAHDFHKHIPYPYVEKANEEDLTDEYKTIYNEYLTYLENNIEDGGIESGNNFDELKFFAEIKKRPKLFFGKVSLISLRDQIWGMRDAFSICNYEDPFYYFGLFADWYYNELPDKSGYACWWNHLIYISGGFDDQAFHHFFKVFEQYLKDVHNVSLPEI